MEWKQELLKRLDALADKLGTTAAYLWSTLVKQAISSGISDAIWGVFFVILSTIAYFVGKALWKKGKDHEDNFAAGAFAWAVSAAAFMGGLNFLVCAIQEFYNPAYYALHEVLQTLSK